METLGQLKEIVKNAPDGATHHQRYRCGNVYFKFRDGEFWFYEDVNCCYEQIFSFHNDSMRSLSDIKLIIELMEGKKKAYQAYVALEEIKQKYNGENKVAKELLKSAYECDEFALTGDLRKDIKEFLGGL